MSAAHIRAAARAWRLLEAIFQQPAMRERLQWDSAAAAFAITQVEMTRDMTQLTVKWRAMDFAAQEMESRLGANAAAIRKSLAKAAGFRRVPRLKFVLDFPAEEKLIETDKLDIDYILEMWKANEKSNTGEAMSLAKRFDDLIQRRLRIYSRTKQYHSAKNPPPVLKGDIGTVIAKALRVVFKVSDEHSRGASEVDLWEQLQEEIRKDGEVEGVFWELCGLVADRDLTGDELKLVFKEGSDSEGVVSDLSSVPDWNQNEAEILDEPADLEHEPAISDSESMDHGLMPSVEAFSNRVEYAMYRIVEILHEPSGPDSSIESSIEQHAGNKVTGKQIEVINGIIDSLSEEERERLCELMQLDDVS